MSLMPKRYLFICYWSISDNLTIATVLPRLKVLQQRSDTEAVILVTIERDSALSLKGDLMQPLTRVKHIPFQTGKYQGSIVEKVKDFLQLPAWLASLAKENKLDTVLAHGTPAGALAYKLWQRIKLPFYVSSFEPHANYMMESGVWRKHGLKYKFQKYWEDKQKELASGLMPVAESYRDQLISKGVRPEKIFTVPCSVNAAEFKFNPGARAGLRKELDWQNAVAGIYVGKFGDLYYDAEAFQIFQMCFKLLPDFRLVILTPDPIKIIEEKILKQNLDPNYIFLASVSHKQVPVYLSASDFAFATFKPGPSKRYLSPVKIGEYWANGLPVLLTEGVGDASDIIKNEGGGALFDLQQEGSLEQALLKVHKILKNPAHRQDIPELAQKYRSADKIGEAYDYFFGDNYSKL